MATPTTPDIRAVTGPSVVLEPPEKHLPRHQAQRHSYRKLLLWLLGVLVLLGGATYWIVRHGRSEAQTLYAVTTVARGMVAKTVTASGTLKPWSVVDIKSKAGGRVDELNVEIGDSVKKNQVIARIDPTDTLLTVRTAQADLDASRAKQNQSVVQYGLQVRQSALSVQEALAQLDTAKANLGVMQSRLQSAQDQAQAQGGLTNSSIGAAEANYQNAVKVRQQLDSTQPQDRATAQAAYDQSAATAENARINLERQKALLAKGFVAASVVDQAEASYKVAASQVTATQTRLNALDREQQTDREAADARVAQAKAQLENVRAQSVDIQNRANAVKEARATVRQAATQVRQAEANLALAQANRANNAIRRQDIEAAKASAARSEATLTNASKTLNETTVRSPIDGVVLEKYVEQGTIITSGQSFNSTGTSLVQIGDVSKMYVNVSVDETDIAVIEEGQSVAFTVDAYKDISFEGKVARINPEAQVENNVTTYAVRVEVDNSHPMFRVLRPGMNATCQFFAGNKEGVVTVPAAALHTDERGAYVDVAADGKPAPANATGAGALIGSAATGKLLTGVHTERRDVEVGLEGNETIEIVSGLQPGENIVVQTITPTQSSASSTSGGSPFGGGGPPPGGPPPGGGGGGRSGGFGGPR